MLGMLRQRGKQIARIAPHGPLAMRHRRGVKTCAHAPLFFLQAGFCESINSS